MHRFRQPAAIFGLFFVLLATLSGCRDNLSRVIVVNDSACPLIRVRLENPNSGEVLRGQVAPGERQEFIVQPDVYYDYIIDFTAGGENEQGLRCTAVEEGQVRVPPGTSQTFTLVVENQ
jgi:hypothetical protein